MKILTTFVLLLAFSKCVFCQVHFKGKVIDKNKNPVRNISVQFSSDDNKVLTNTDGTFSKILTNRAPETNVTITILPTRYYLGYDSLVTLKYSYNSERFRVILRRKYNNEVDKKGSEKATHEAKKQPTSKDSREKTKKLPEPKKIKTDGLVLHHLSNLRGARADEATKVVEKLGALQIVASPALNTLDSIVRAKTEFRLRLSAASAVVSINKKSAHAAENFNILLSDFEGDSLTLVLRRIHELNFFDNLLMNGIKRLIVDNDQQKYPPEVRIYAYSIAVMLDQQLLRDYDSSTKVLSISANAIKHWKKFSDGHFEITTTKLLKKSLLKGGQISEENSGEISDGIIAHRQYFDEDIMKIIRTNKAGLSVLEAGLSKLRNKKYDTYNQLKKGKNRYQQIDKVNQEIASFIESWVGLEPGNSLLKSTIDHIDDVDYSSHLATIFYPHNEILIPYIADIEFEDVSDDYWRLSYLLDSDTTFQNRINASTFARYSSSEVDSVIISNMVLNHNQKGRFNFLILKQFVLGHSAASYSWSDKNYYLNYLRKSNFDSDVTENIILKELYPGGDIRFAFNSIEKLKLTSSLRIIERTLELVRSRDATTSFMSINYLLTIDHNKLADEQWRLLKFDVSKRILNKDDGSSIRANFYIVSDKGEFISGDKGYILLAAKLLKTGPWKYHTELHLTKLQGSEIFENHVTFGCQRKDSKNCRILYEQLQLLEIEKK